jgi:hypothetical protein
VSNRTPEYLSKGPPSPFAQAAAELGLVHARLRRGADFEAMQEVAKLLGRNSRERWEMRQRERAKSAVQFDYDVEREEEIGR